MLVVSGEVLVVSGEVVSVVCAFGVRIAFLALDRHGRGGRPSISEDAALDARARGPVGARSQGRRTRGGRRPVGLRRSAEPTFDHSAVNG